MHRDEHDGDADAKVDAQRVPEQHRRHEPGEDGGHRAAVLLQDGVGELEEKGGEDALRRVVGRWEESTGESIASITTQLNSTSAIFCMALPRVKTRHLKMLLWLRFQHPAANPLML